MSRYLHIIEDSPVYPIIYDSSRQVLSMPPIVRPPPLALPAASEHPHSPRHIPADQLGPHEDHARHQEHLHRRDGDGCDQARHCRRHDRHHVLRVLRGHVRVRRTCPLPSKRRPRSPEACHSVEPVNVVYEAGCPGGARTVVSPPLTSRPFVARASYINSCTGLNLSCDEILVLLRKMGHTANAPSPHAGGFAALNAQASLVIDPEDEIHVHVPPTRPDILHECDVMEEVAIAYGFDNLKKTFPQTNTVGKPLPVNKLTDVLRRLCSEASWTEVLPLILVRGALCPFPRPYAVSADPSLPTLEQCSHDENYKFLNRVDPGNEAVVLANPKTIEYQIVRTSLLPGLLKSVRENRKHTLPLRIFEVSDVVVQDTREERQARNVRRMAAVFCGRKAGFEVVHGLLDRLMVGLGVRNLVSESSTGESGYYIKASDGVSRLTSLFPRVPCRGPALTHARRTILQTPLSSLAGLPTSTTARRPRAPTRTRRSRPSRRPTPTTRRPPLRRPLRSRRRRRPHRLPHRLLPPRARRGATMRRRARSTRSRTRSLRRCPLSLAARPRRRARRRRRRRRRPRSRTSRSAAWGSCTRACSRRTSSTTRRRRSSLTLSRSSRCGRGRWGGG